MPNESHHAHADYRSSSVSALLQQLPLLPGPFALLCPLPTVCTGHMLTYQGLRLLSFQSHSLTSKKGYDIGPA